MTGIKEFRGDAGVGTWLYRLTVNTCLDRRRSASAREIASDPETFARLSTAGSQERDASAAEEADRVRAAVSSLPEKLRMPVLLRYFDDLSYEEMAKALDCSAGTVASRLNRGHRLLREKLEKWGMR
jgi:RNA polymerase sigma-70 factor (ECF subfamily)